MLRSGHRATGELSGGISSGSMNGGVVCGPPWLGRYYGGSIWGAVI